MTVFIKDIPRKTVKSLYSRLPKCPYVESCTKNSICNGCGQHIRSLYDRERQLQATLLKRLLDNKEEYTDEKALYPTVEAVSVFVIEEELYAIHKWKEPA